MIKCKRSRATLAGMLMVGLLVGCATNKLHREGLEALDQGRYVEGVTKLAQAVKEEPDNIAFQVDLKARREAATQALIASADSARAAGRLDEAESLYRTVLEVDSTNNRGQRGLEGVASDRRHAVLVQQATADFDGGKLDAADEKVRKVLAENPGYAAAQSLRSKIDAAREPVATTPRLVPRDASPVTLQFRDANTKMVFEVLSRQTGINFVFDKDVRSDGKTTIFVDRVPVEQVIELILGQNQLARQILSDNMVMIYPNTPQKQKDYQDQIVKALYLVNADPKQVQTMLKTVLNANTTFIDERANTVIIRDTPETVRMAEKLIASLDIAEPEVMLEVEVLEITRSKLQQLGINYPTAFSLTQTSPSGGPFTRNDYDRQTGDTILATPLSASVDLLKQVGASNLLASPRIRARNHEKAKVLIGSRVPVITNSVTPTSSGAAVVTGAVQYLDVGLTLDVQPTIYLSGDVAIAVNLEVSTIVKEVRSGGGSDGNQGTLAYEIGTRNAQTLLQLKDGETQILAGLIQDTDKQNSSHIPGLGDIPVLGRLFGSKRTSRDKTEIVLSITPRIIRSQARPSSENTEFYFGTESNSRAAPLGAAPATAPAAAPAGGANLAPAGGNTGSQAAPRDTQGSNDAEAAPQPAARAPPPAGPVAAPAIAWDAPGQTGVGQSFDVAVRMSGGSAMRNVRAQLRYDPAVLVLQSAEAGSAVPADLQASTVPRVNQVAGVVPFVANAPAENPIAGDGSLMVLHFRATTPNPGSKLSLQVAAVGADGGTVPPTNEEPLTLVVTP